MSAGVDPTIFRGDEIGKETRGPVDKGRGTAEDAGGGGGGRRGGLFGVKRPIFEGRSASVDGGTLFVSALTW
jgi:hypothetical protein